MLLVVLVKGWGAGEKLGYQYFQIHSSLYGDYVIFNVWYDYGKKL